MRQGESWKECKTRVLKEYFPLFVREKMIRELIVFNFQGKSCPLRQFIKDVIDAVEFLQYQGTEGEIVERILMNLHPEIMAQATLLPRPNSYRELRDLVGLMEERMAVSRERKRSEVVSTALKYDRGKQGNDRPSGGAVGTQQTNRGAPKCWQCGRQGHMQKQCRLGNTSGNVAVVKAVENQADQKVNLYNARTTGSNVPDNNNKYETTR
jgi:hypothetical protein